MTYRAQQPSPCSLVDFDSLLFGDYSDPENQASIDHLERCSACQQRLESLASANTPWKVVREYLRPHDDHLLPQSSRVDHVRDFVGASRPRPLKLDFLAPPSHPEMLGRLGRYEIESVIGAGGMGIVLKGFDTELNRPVAVKVLSPQLSQTAAARHRFAREARAAASIVHENVVAIHDVDCQNDAPFLVMQYIGGQSLAERVEANGPLSATESLRIGIQAAAGLAAAHTQGVIHRDVKPANILLENGVERAMLTDFGLARAADDATLTHSGTLAGTPHYMSPEQARGEVLDDRSDLFSLGATMYFMVTGHAPFRADRVMAVLHRVCNEAHRPVQEVDPTIPDDVADVIDRLLEKRPGRRYRSATEARQALEHALIGLQRPRKPNIGRWLRRRRRPIMACLAAVGVIALAVSAWLWRGAADVTSTQEPPTQADLTWLVDAQLFERMPEELDAMDEALQRLERRTYSNGAAVDAANDSWRTNLRAIDVDLQKLERALEVK